MSRRIANGTLIKFPPPLVRQPQPVILAPTQSVYLDANFPFPAGYSHDTMDVNSLQLRWLINIEGNPVRMYADFHRVVWAYYDPYWAYPPYPLVSGTVIVHRR